MNDKMEKRRKLRKTAWTFAAIGSAVFLIGLLITVSSSGSSAGIGFIICIVGFYVAAFAVMTLHNNPANGQDGPLQKPVKASKADMTYYAQLQAMQSMPGSTKEAYFAQASKEWEAGKAAEWQAEKTKKAMVKGAVVGGIIGGDAGAVVGAMVGKEKAKK